MVTQLVIEVVIGTITLIAGNFFWQIHKRGKFLIRALHDTPFLSQLICRSALDTPSPVLATYVAKLQPGYVLNIQVVISSDKEALSRTKMIFGSMVAAALVGSYFLGVPYLVINVVVFFLSALAPLSQPARRSAAQQILTLAVILDKWRSENGTECEEFIKRAWAFRTLYDVVKDARGPI